MFLRSRRKSHVVSYAFIFGEKVQNLYNELFEQRLL